MRVSSPIISTSVWDVAGRTMTRVAPASWSRLIRSRSAGWPWTEMVMAEGSRPGALAELIGRDAIRQPAVAPGHDALEHVLGAAAEEHGRVRLLRRLRIGPDGREVVVLAVELRLALRPQLLHGQDRLPRLRPAVVEIAAHDLRLLAQPPGADAEEEAPAAEEVEGRDLLGQEQRMPLGDEDDAGPELDAARGARGARQGHEGIDEVRVGLGNDPVLGAREAALRLHGNERVLGAPERLEAELFGLSGHGADIHEVGGQGYGDSDVHGESSLRELFQFELLAWIM